MNIYRHFEGEIKKSSWIGQLGRQERKGKN